MQVIEGLENLNLPAIPRAVCVGAFDGFHVGHQYLLSQLCATAAEHGCQSAIVTFEPIPSQFFAPPDTPARRLVTRAERISLAASLCCELMAILHFDRVLAAWDAHAFIAEVLVKRVNAKLLIASGKHMMGSDHADLDRIADLCREFGIALHTAPVLQLGNLKVNSSAIRGLLWEGRVEEATGLLGRHYSLTGAVVSGRGVGRGLGFPTANLSVPAEKLVPADGVYAGLAYDETVTAEQRQPCPAAIAIGKAPTFDLGERLIEAHLLSETPVDVAGHTLRLEFIRRLRGQQKFADTEALTRQIALDVEHTRALAASVA
ncbi:MAG: bifunctional riboflavin kinase/FMN adenylyltransferase, partial [Armatimonadota bacterium]